MAEKKPATTVRIYEQIEQTAGFHEPAIYDLLTFQSSLATEADPLASTFIPFSSVRPRRQEDACLFVIGLIPPSANVTGRLLDRSATVAALQGFVEGPADASGSQAPPIDYSYKAPGDPPKGRNPIVTMPGYQVAPSMTPFNPGASYQTAGVAEPDPVVTQLSALQVYQAIFDAYKRKFGREPTVTECWIYTAQSLRETSGRWPNNNPGYIGNFGSYKPGTFSAESQTNGKDKGYYVTYPTVEAGADAFVRHLTNSSNVVQTAQSGDVLGYVTSLAQTGYYGASIKIYYDQFPAIMQQVAAQLQKAGAPGFPSTAGLPKLPPTCGFTEDIYAYRKRVGFQGNKSPPGVGIFRAQANSAYGGCALLPDGSPAAGSTPGWQATGSSNAQQGQKALATKANRDLNQTELGQALGVQQQATIRALQIALQQMANTPPLRMVINPTSFKVAEEKISSDGNWGRNGPIVQHWGEGQTKVTASGKVAGFFAMDASDSSAANPGVSPGLTRMARNFSASYQNFLSLYLLYKNNGAIWLEDFQSPGHKPANLSLVGSVYIYYDHTMYVGSFDSFNVNESDEKPFSLEYDFSFTVRATFLLDPVADPRLNYGDPSLFGQPGLIPTSSEKDPGFPILTGAAYDAEVARIQRDAELDAADPIRFFSGPPVTDDEVARQLFGRTPAKGQNLTTAPSRKKK